MDRKFPTHLDRLAELIALDATGKEIATRIAMIPITTINSTKVKPEEWGDFFI
jgi:hypothetical protein